jgi:hypothetical protein
MTDAFAPGQVLNFGSLAYVVDCYDKLHPLKEAAPAGDEPPTPPSLLGLLGADLRVLARHIQCGLGSNPIVSDRRQVFYMLANVHHLIATGEVLPLLECFWYYLLYLQFGIQNAAASFQLELEHLVSREVPRSAILSSAASIDFPSLRAFLEVLSGNDPEYDSNDIDYYAPSCMCFYIDGENHVDNTPELTLPDQSPRSHELPLGEGSSTAGSPGGSGGRRGKA